MNAVMTYATAADQMQRYDAIRRKNAETAYDRNVSYNGENQKLLESLEALLTGVKEPETVLAEQRVQRDQSEQKDSQPFGQLDASQMKKIVLPLGQTLEKTIANWREVELEVNAISEPIISDPLLAAAEFTDIIQTEALIAPQTLEQSLFRQPAMPFQETIKPAMAVELPSSQELEKSMMKKRYQQAISSYSFQAQAKQNGYQLEWPSFYKVA